MIDSGETPPLSRRAACTASARRMRARQREAGMVNVSFPMSGDVVAAVDRLKIQLGMPARAEIFEIAVRRLLNSECSKT